MLKFPQSTECHKIIPKKAIYANNEIKASEKERIDAEIKRVIVVNVVSPTNIAIAAGEKIKSFCVVQFSLKHMEFHEQNIVLLTKLVKQNMLMVLEFNGKVKIAVYYTKLICTEWMDIEEASIQLNGLNLDKIWENIVIQIGNIDVAEGNTLDEQIKKNEDKLKTLKQIEQLERKARREMNPRKKFNIVQKVRTLQMNIREEE